MAFVKEPEPARFTALPAVEGARRIVAPNPSVMTYHGTNSWLIDDNDGGISLLDPGPDDPAHLDAIVAAGQGRIRRILISHAHSDHYKSAPTLRARLDVPIIAWHTSGSDAFEADQHLQDGERIAGLTTVFTPGHAADHICFERPDGVVFTADHVMGWASSVVSPPGGDMRAYVSSLALLLERPARLYLPGHGPAIDTPHDYVRDLLAHRIHREHAIAQAVRRAPFDTWTLVLRLYASVHPNLRLAAERNVIAHLLKLRDEGKVVRHEDGLWHWIANQESNEHEPDRTL